MKLYSNIFYNLVGNILMAGLSLVAAKTIYHKLGKDIFGLIYFIDLLTTLINAFFEKSVKMSLVKEISANLKTEIDSNVIESNTTELFNFNSPHDFIFVKWEFSAFKEPKILIK